MPLMLHALGAYASYGRDECDWRGVDYDINKFVKALKGKEFKGHGSLIDVLGNRRQFTQANPSNALIVFSYWAARRLHELQLRGITLVPVPSSKCIQFGMESAPLRMARALQTIARDSGVTMEPWLRFRQEMPSVSSGGGSRNQAVLEAALVGSPAISRRRVVLIDDVKTTGAHLRACAAVLRNSGAEVDTVLAAASTVWGQHPNPLMLDPVDLEPPVWPGMFR